jgi:non-specific protein-tyrosine kinase
MSDIEVLEDKQLNLRDYLSILRVRKWTIILSALLITALAVGMSYRRTPIYKATARVLVKPLNLDPSEVQFSTTNLNTETQLARSDAVATIAKQELQSQEEVTTLMGGLSVEVPADTEILVFNYSHPDASEAQLRSQAFAEAYLEHRRQSLLEDLLASSETLQERITELNSQLEDVNEDLATARTDAERAALQTQASSLVTQLGILQQQVGELTPPDNLRVGQIVESADLPTTPASPKPLRDGILGLFLGLSLGIAIAYLRERLDDRLRGRVELEVLSGAPVLAAIPQVATWRKENQPMIVSLEEPKSAPAEAYRTLRTAVLFAALQRKAKTLLITSPHEGEGKSSTSANLAVVLAQAGKRVVVVSGDLRKPRLGRFFGFDNSVGLTNALAGEVPLWECLMQAGIDNLRVLPAGPIPGNPAELLGSSAMGNVLAQLREAADFVLIDGPPVLVVADAVTVAPLVDAVLLVADAQTTHRGAVEHARQQLEQVDAKIIGAVYNNFDPSKGGATPYYYRYSYAYEEVEVPAAASKRSG